MTNPENSRGRTQASAVPANCPRPAAWWRSARIACAHACVGAYCRTGRGARRRPHVSDRARSRHDGAARHRRRPVQHLERRLDRSRARDESARICSTPTSSIRTPARSRTPSSIWWPACSGCRRSRHAERDRRAQRRGRGRLACSRSWRCGRSCAGSPDRTAPGWSRRRRSRSARSSRAHTPHIQLLMIFGIPLVLLAFDRLRERRRSARRRARRRAGGRGPRVRVLRHLRRRGAGRRRDRLRARRATRTGWRSPSRSLVAAVRHVARARAVHASARGVRRSRRDGASRHPRIFRDRERLRHVARAGATPGCNQGGADSTFPGLIALGLAVAAVVTARRGERQTRRLVWGYVAMAGLAMWASFGPDAGLYRLVGLIPGAALLRAPVRIGVVVTFAVAVLAGFGVRRLEVSPPLAGAGAGGRTRDRAGGGAVAAARPGRVRRRRSRSWRRLPPRSGRRVLVQLQVVRLPQPDARRCSTRRITGSRSSTATAT